MRILRKIRRTLKVHYGLENFNSLECAVATTGTFDGVHLGHEKILSQLVKKAREVDGESVLLTFSPHPRLVLQPDVPLELLSSIEEKTRLLAHSGLDHLIIQPFTKEFSRTPSLEFVREILVNTIGVKHLVIGYDHHFGRNREGSFDHLKEFGPIYGFEVEEISALDIEHTNVSSTKVRAALNQGNVTLANDYLGYPYSLRGTVIYGDQIGRTLGFPTANIRLDFKHKLIPQDGVYAVWAIHKGIRYKAMANIGGRPTVGALNRSIEVHLCDHSLELYNEVIQFEIHHRLRSVEQFNTLDELKQQLQKDKELALSLLA
tara:strand:- start:549 stop:1502 length:954 start_codon:yes stop_codon:yes gene_type:complete